MVSYVDLVHGVALYEGQLWSGWIQLEDDEIVDGESLQQYDLVYKPDPVYEYLTLRDQRREMVLMLEKKGDAYNFKKFCDNYKYKSLSKKQYKRLLQLELNSVPVFRPPKLSLLTRSIMLLTKLRAKCRRVSVEDGKVFPDWYWKYLLFMQSVQEAQEKDALFVEPQLVDNQMDMQDTPHGDPPIKQDKQAGSSVLPEQAIIATASVPQEKIDLSQYIVPEALQIDGAWNRIYQVHIGQDNIVKFLSNDTVGTKKFSIVVWKDLLDSLNTAKSPICEVLANYQYVRGTVRLYFQMESTEMMAGCIMIVLKYMGNKSKTNDNKKSVYTLSQLPNIRLQAGSGGHGEMLVPFVFPYGMMLTNPSADLGELTVAVVEGYVLNSLRGPSTGCSAIEVQMQISFSFENIQVSGLVPRGGQPTAYTEVDNQSGLESLIPMAGKLINVLAEGNRDKPRASCERVPQVPQAVQNLSVGTGCLDYANTMRLDNEAYIPQTDSDVEYSLQHLSEIKSLFRIFELSKDNTSGSLLKDKTTSKTTAFAHGLLLNQQQYYVEKAADLSKKKLAIYAIPSCDVIASDKCYNRARIVYTFEIIATKFHAAQIGVAFIPGPIKATLQLTALTARNTCYKIINIQKEKQVEFVVPYQSHSLVVPRQTVYDRTDDYFAMGHIYVWCVVPLMQTCSVCDAVEINVYKSCRDIELYLPSQPLLVPAWKNEYPEAVGAIAMAKDGYAPWLIDKWHYLDATWLRYGEGSDHITQFNVLTRGGIYKISDTDEIKLPQLSCYHKVGDAYQVVVDYQKYMVAVYDKNGYYYGIMFNKQCLAEAQATAKVSALNWGNFSNFCEAMVTLNGLGKLVAATALYDAKYGIIDMILLEVVKNQIGDQTTTLFSGTSPLDQHKYLGRVLFGEDSVKLKDQLRRFVPYCDLVNGLFEGTFITQFVVPLNVTTLSLALREKVSSIELLHLPYLYAKGSFNLTIIADEFADNQWFWFIWRPDSNVNVLTKITSPNLKESFYSQGYAVQIMHPKVNPILQVNCPFGRISNKVLLHHNYDSADISPYHEPYLHFGALMVGSNGPIRRMTILQSIGDDFVGSTCVGFPGMSFIADFPLEAQPNKALIDSFKARLVVKNKVKEVPWEMVSNQMEEVESQGMFDWMKPSVITKTEQAADQLTAACVNVEKVLNPTVLDKVTELMHMFPNTVKERCSEIKAQIVLVLSHFMQVVVTPTKEVAAVALASIFGGIILHSTNLVSNLSSYFSDLLNKLSSSNEHFTEDNVGLVSNQNGEESIWSAFSEQQQAKLCGLVFAGVTSSMGLAVNAPTSWKDVCKYSATELPRNCKNAVSFMSFFQWVWDLVLVVFNYCKTNLLPGMDFERTVVQSNIGIRAWAREASKFVDPMFFSTIQDNPILVNEVSILVEYGRKIVDSLHKTEFLSDTKLNPLRLLAVTRLKDLQSLQKKCADMKVTASCEQETFVVWDYSKYSKIGKSHNCKIFLSDMLRAVGKPFRQDSIFYLQPLMTQFDGCGAAECAVFDDFMIIDSDQTTVPTFAPFFLLTGPGRFKPHCATIEEKHTIWTPSIVQVCSNTGYFNHSILAQKDAFHRRRHIVCEWDVKPEYRDCLQGTALDWTKLKKRLTAEQLDEFVFLTFKIVDPVKQGEVMWELSYQDYRNFRIHNYINFVTEQSVLAVKRKALYTAHGVQESTITAMQRAIFAEEHQWMDEDYIFDVKNEMEMPPLGRPKLRPYYAENQIDTESSEYVSTDEAASSIEIVSEEEPQEVSGSNPMSTSDLLFMLKRIDSTTLPKVDKCVHDQFEPGMWYSNGCFHRAGSSKDLAAVMSDQPCPIDVEECVWRRIDKLEEDMLAWAKYRVEQLNIKSPIHINGGTAEYSPYYFREKYRQNEELDKFVVKFELSWFESIRNFFKKTIPKMFKTMWSLVKRIKWYLVGLAAILGIGASVYGLSKVETDSMVRLKTSFQSRLGVAETSNNIMSSGDARTLRAKLKVNKLQINTNPSVDVGAQSGGIQLNPATLMNVKRNTFFLELVSLSKENKPLKPLFLRGWSPGGRIGVLPYHYLELLVKREELRESGHVDYYENRLVIRKYNMNLGDFSVCIPTDIKQILFKPKQLLGTTLWRIEFPARCDNFRDYTSLIPTAAEHDFVGSAGCLIELSNEVKIVPLKLTLGCFKTRPDNICQSLQIDAAYKYDYGAPGVCGSMLVVNNKIIGMHVAGEKNVLGVSEPLVKEMFKEIRISAGPMIQLQDIDKASLCIATDVDELGTVLDKLVNHDSGKTRIQCSEVHNQYFQTITEPAPLHSKDPRFTEPRNVMLEGVEIHGMIPKPFDPDLLERVEKHYGNIINATVRPSRAKIGKFNTEVAVMGIAGLEGYNSIDFNTSEGWPLVYHRPPGAHNKSWLFELNEDRTKLINFNPWLKSMQMVHGHMRHKGLISPTIFIDNKKDCRIKKEKVSKRACTRIFSTSPIEFTITTRMYYLDFVAAYQTCRIKNGTAVGINVDSVEWTSLIDYLSGPGKFTKFVAGDYSKFGPRLQPEVVKAAIRIMINWYKTHGDESEENALIREILGEEIINSVHQCIDIVYRAFIGAPSGSPLTVILNDLVNHMYLRYVWLDLKCGTLQDFEDNVRLVTYGDDSIATVSDEKISVFNVNTISKTLAKYDIKYTDAAKNDLNDFRDFESIDTVSFLKRQFVWNDDICGYLAPLPLSVCLDIMNWVWESPDPVEATKINVVESIESLFGHGEEVYEMHREGISKMWNKKYTCPLPVRSWQELKEIYFPGELGVDMLV